MRDFRLVTLMNYDGDMAQNERKWVFEWVLYSIHVVMVRGMGGCTGEKMGGFRLVTTMNSGEDMGQNERKWVFEWVYSPFSW